MSLVDSGPSMMHCSLSCRVRRTALCICRPVGRISGSCNLKMPNSRSDGTGDGGMHARAHKMALLCRVENRECRRQHSLIATTAWHCPGSCQGPACILFRKLYRSAVHPVCTVQNTNWAAAQQVWPCREGLGTCHVRRCGGSKLRVLWLVSRFGGLERDFGCRIVHFPLRAADPWMWAELGGNFGCKMQATQDGFVFSFCFF